MLQSRRPRIRFMGVLAVTVLMSWIAAATQAQQTPPTKRPTPPPRPTFPSFTDVSRGYTKVTPSGGTRSFYTLWRRDKDGQVLAELPAGYARQKHFISLTLVSGQLRTGQLYGDGYVYWKRYDRRLALMMPSVGIRSTGDRESRMSLKRLYKDRVILEVPILAMGPSGGPVIDADMLMVGQATKFFGGAYRPLSPRLVQIKVAKAFPKNIELAFEVPMARTGRLETLHYSVSLIPDNTGYRPRKADERVGFFATMYQDYGKYNQAETWVRYINRWHLRKRDPKLKLSPPVEPLVFYIEHTAPVRYRRWIREGVLYWNKAFEKVGLFNAIEVKFQDAQTGLNMDKDPEDVRFNFIRWLSGINVSYGPSRVHPLTGQILDADIVIGDGWIREYLRVFKEELPKMATSGLSAETLAWLNHHPQWDPRIRLADPAQRDFLIAQKASQGVLPFGGHPLAQGDPNLAGDDGMEGLVGRSSQISDMCMASRRRAMDLSMMRMLLTLNNSGSESSAETGEDKEGEEKKEEPKEGEEKKEEPKEGEEKKEESKEGEEKKEEPKEGEEKKEEDKKKPKPKPRVFSGDMIDGIPESFIGPLLADMVAHEVGHTLGLRHNFKGSSSYTYEEVNSEKHKESKTIANSVMDYLPININVEAGVGQGDYAMTGLGPYDIWAIEYGYTFDRNLAPILSRVADPELQYATDEDTFGSDPLASPFDFSSDPLAYANNQIHLAGYIRKHLLSQFVRKGESWARARHGYELSLFLQLHSAVMMSDWVGGAFVHRDRKGDKNGRAPIEVVPADRQREALTFIIHNIFRDESYGLTPELLKHMTVDKWLDTNGFISLMEESTWAVHDRIIGIQSSLLTRLLNPSKLDRIYDNEFRVPSDNDVLTLPEMLDTLTNTIWSELDNESTADYTARKPLISSIRRNLQREHLDRLIDLSMSSSGFAVAQKPIANLSTTHLTQIKAKIEKVLEHVGDSRIDAYSKAHLSDAKLRIEKSLDAEFIYNTDDIGGGSTGGFLFFKQNSRNKPLAP